MALTTDSREGGLGQQRGKVPWQAFPALRIVLTALLVLPAACSEEPASGVRMGDVTEERVLHEVESGENWLVNGGRFSGEHFSPLTQITADNVEQLELAWVTDIPSFTFALEPIVVDGVVYLSGSLSRVFALDAASGEMLWQFHPDVPLDISLGNSYGARFSRGVAVWEGRIFVGSGDCMLIAIDAATATQAWASPICDTREGVGAHIRSAPRVGGGMVFAGYSGSTSARGSLVAFDAETGEEAWRFWTVPGDPAKGFETPELELASATWTNGWSEMGGGSVWEGIRYDPVTESLFFGTSAPGPGNPAVRGPGDALFSNSIIAVDAKTGKYKWHYQTVPEDAWDYDAAPPLIVTDLRFPAETGETGPQTQLKRRVVLSAPKNGFFYVLDALTGELLAADAIVEVNWATHIDMKTGRPVERPEARYYQGENAGQPVLVKPSPGGSHTWHPMSFSPLTGLVYIPATDLAANFLALVPAGDEAGVTDRAGWTFEFVPNAWAGEQFPMGSGQLIAWDPVQREARWTVAHPVPYNGGVLSTASNLVFQGTAGGDFHAYRADTGARLWTRRTGTPILSPPVTFQLDTEQYVLAAAGVGGGNGVTIAPYISTPDAQGPARVFAFKLGGAARMPARRDFTPVPTPPEQTASPEQIERGEAIWRAVACEYCHGVSVVGVGRQMQDAKGQRVPGAIPDLRYMAAETHAQWHAIVLGGSRKHLGMPAYHEAMSVEDAGAVHAYVVAQSWQLYRKSLAVSNQLSQPPSRH